MKAEVSQNGKKAISEKTRILKINWDRYLVKRMVITGLVFFLAAMLIYLFWSSSSADGHDSETHFSWGSANPFQCRRLLAWIPFETFRGRDTQENTKLLQVQHKVESFERNLVSTKQRIDEFTNQMQQSFKRVEDLVSQNEIQLSLDQSANMAMLERSVMELERSLSNREKTVDGVVNQQKEQLNELQNFRVELNEVQTLLNSLAERYKTDATESDNAKVKHLIDEAIRRYDADKTGLVDFASKAAGATIINNPFVEPGQVSFFHGISSTIGSFFGEGAPSVKTNYIIPRDCQRLNRMGNDGSIMIKFIVPVNITAVSYEHIPKQTALTGNIDSAPKTFAINGYEESLLDIERFLGNFTYDVNGPALQSFPVQVNDAPAMSFIEVIIYDNLGGSSHTDFCKLRVHGHLPPPVKSPDTVIM